MRRTAYTVTIAVAVAVLFWIASAIVDYHLSTEGSFWEWFVAGVPLHHVALRSLGIVILALAAFVLGIVGMRGAVQEYVSTEEECRAVMDAANDAIFIHDAESLAILDVNRRTIEMFGYAPDEIRRLHIGQISSGKPPYSLEYAKRWIRKALTEGPQVVEWLCKDKRGKLFWTEIHLKTIVLRGKTHLLAVVRDITKHKAVEKAYEKSEKKYQTIFNSSPVAIGLIERDGRIVESNDRLMEWLGYEPSEIVGKNVRDLPLVDEDRMRLLDALKRRMGGERVPPYEIAFVTKDGDEIACEVHAELMRAEEDEVLCELAMIVNVADRKRAERALVESEKKYRAIFETSPEAIVVLDTKGFVQDVNGRVTDMLGFTPDEVLGKHLLRVPVLTMSSRVKGLKALLKRVAGKDLPPYELDFVTKAGERRVGLIRAKELRDDEGRITGDLVLISDITDDKRTKEQSEQND